MLVLASLILWAAGELFLRARRRGGRRTGTDWTFFALFTCIAAGIILGFRFEHIEATVVGGGWIAVVLGELFLLGGVSLRLWAIVALGRFFQLTVSIQPGHRVVHSGPYRVLRHPSYAGLLLGTVGLGIALDSWLSLLILLALPLVGIIARIRVEETALIDALGEEYLHYASQTRRLIPGVW